MVGRGLSSGPVLLLVLAIVYLGMVLGTLPRLRVDRTGVALLGAIALVVLGSTGTEQAVAFVDVPTITVLFGMMVLSAQLRLGGFYGAVSRRIAAAPVGGPGLLAVVIAVAGGLSAVFTNDVVVLAMAPLLVDGLRARRVDPLPYLLALACAANVGSAATLIGNPQNILVGEVLDLSFARYLAVAALPAAGGLVVVWAVIRAVHRDRLSAPAAASTAADPPGDLPRFDAWQSGKGLALAALLMGAFLLTPWPREALALAAAGVVLLSRRFHTRETLGLVDWELLVLFVGLFVVNGAAGAAGLPERALGGLAGVGIRPDRPEWMLPITVVLSNLVSNVPAVMLLLPFARGPRAGALLALGSTLAGNLILVGSIANLIVAEQAGRKGIRISWLEHARVGVPITLLTLALAAAALALAGGWIAG
jgi:Na+/H+ antiporter NhaD/arsenite permease-like protein